MCNRPVAVYASLCERASQVCVSHGKCMSAACRRSNVAYVYVH